MTKNARKKCGNLRFVLNRIQDVLYLTYSLGSVSISHLKVFDLIPRLYIQNIVFVSLFYTAKNGKC